MHWVQATVAKRIRAKKFDKKISVGEKKNNKQMVFNTIYLFTVSIYYLQIVNLSEL